MANTVGKAIEMTEPIVVLADGSVSDLLHNESVETNIQCDNSQINCPSMTPTKSIVEMFTEMSIELDKRHEKYERIVRLGRDITIESKKIIFLLHRHTTESYVIEKAEDRFQNLRKRYIKPLALELENEDLFKYLRAFTPGLQEYIEAVAFHHFLKTESLISYEELQKSLVFEVLVNTPNSSDESQNQYYSSQTNRGRGGRGRNYWRGNYNRKPRPAQVQGQEKVELEGVVSSASTSDIVEIVVASTIELIDLTITDEKSGEPDDKIPETKFISILFPQTDFILGLLDVTGELMRGCVSSFGCDNSEFAFKTCNLVRHIYKGMLGLHPLKRDMTFKMETLSSSVIKMERSCCQFKIRETQGQGVRGSVCFPFRGFQDDEESGSDSGLE